MIIPTVTPLGGEPTAHPRHADCRHPRHVGACPACQRAAQGRSEAQLAAAVAARETWATRALPARVALNGRRKPGSRAGPALLNELASPSFSTSAPFQKAA
jgi:hypothetical protein